MEGLSERERKYIHDGHFMRVLRETVESHNRGLFGSVLNYGLSESIWNELSEREQDEVDRFIREGKLIFSIMRSGGEERYVPKPLQREAPRGIQRRAPRGIQRAEKAFALLEACFPKRICNEEIGDAMEVIHKMVAAKRPKWMISVKVASTFFWVITHALLDYIIKVAGALKAVAGKGDSDEK